MQSLPASPAKAPNFIFILGEGHGWTSTSVQMDDAVPNSKSSFIQTPNFEKLAKAGMRLANFYAPSPRCTPSRATFFTGKSPALLHMTFVGEGKGDTGGGVDAGTKVIPPHASMELADQEVTIAELLKRAGYATAHFGKWHVGRVSPAKHGFDETDGANSNGGPDNVASPHPKQLYRMTELGLDFMARQVKAGKPFYLQMSHYASRNPEDALPATVATVKKQLGNAEDRTVGEAAAALDLDITMGMILQKLDELGVAGNTFVVYTTDHGTPGRNSPLNGGKGTVWDGGLRVPFLIRGPGIIPGSCSHVMAIGADLFPTFAELAKVSEPLPKGIEGGSLVQVLLKGDKGSVSRPRQEYVIHFPHYDKDVIGPASAIYLGNYKLIRVYETGEFHLFDLSKDMGERKDLDKQMPDKVKELDQRLTDYLKAVNAQMPTFNANYDPSKAASTLPGDKRGGKRGGGRKAKQ